MYLSLSFYSDSKFVKTDTAKMDETLHNGEDGDEEDEVAEKVLG